MYVHHLKHRKMCQIIVIAVHKCCSVSGYMYSW